MQEMTYRIIETALMLDSTVTKEEAGVILEMTRHAARPVEFINESEAAAVLDICQSSLNKWRRSPDKPEPFPFSTVPNPVAVEGVMYNKWQLLAWKRRRLLASEHAKADQDIT